VPQTLALSNFPASASVMTGFMQLRYRPAKTLFCLAVLLTASPPWAADITRPESQQEYWAQFDHRDWTAAIATAQALVASARERASEQPLKLVEALSLLGNAQLGQGDYISAEATFGEALQIAERNSGSMSANLLDPLRGLGYTLAASGRHAEAVPHLERALIIARRSYGLFDVGQQGILRQLAASMTKTGRTAEAERHMTYLLRVGERTYGRRDPRLVPLLCVIGKWYADTANFQQARLTYRNALDIVERKLGRGDVAAVEPLRGFAGTFTLELLYSTMGLKITQERQPSAADGTSTEYKALNPRYLSEDGEEALTRAIAILESHPNGTRDTLIDTLIQLGDWFQIKHLPDKAMPFYRRAAASVVSSEAAGSAPAPLSFPVRVYYPIPILATRNVTLPAEQVDERYVQVEFTVTGQGDVANARVTDENGTARQVSETLQAIRAARYRPKFVNGEPVATTGMTDRAVFRMRKQPEGQQKES
jgi:tetratricopeptide (TPR) repeat protein